MFAVNDVMAVGALARLRAEGLVVPDDIGLAGFDDISTLRDVYPPLTTVRLPLAAMGEMAARLVLTDAAADHPRVVPVRGEVILRDSTGRGRIRRPGSAADHGAACIWHGSRSTKCTQRGQARLLLPPLARRVRVRYVAPIRESACRAGRGGLMAARHDRHPLRQSGVGAKPPCRLTLAPPTRAAWSR